MFTPSYQAEFKTKELAVASILQQLIENPAVADKEGFLSITAFGNFYRLKPLKKKPKEETE